MIVGYTVEGKPLTKEAYNKRLQKAEEQIKEWKEDKAFYKNNKSQYIYFK